MFLNQKMKSLFTLFFCFSSFALLCQNHGSNSTAIGPVPESVIPGWLAELNEAGLELTEDSIMMSEEFLLLLQDEDSRANLYPGNYTWQQAIQFIQKQELKKAF